MKVLNDAAERGVKMCTDFNDVAKTEEWYQNYLQIVELDRKIVPDQRNASHMQGWKILLFP